jgi:hypothetical protein
MFNFYDLVSFLGSLLRLAGLAVFGLGLGWFVLKAYQRAEGQWPLQAAVFLGLLAFSAATLAVSPGAGGAFTLAAGIALLYGGGKKEKKAEAANEGEDE